MCPHDVFWETYLGVLLYGEAKLEVEFDDRTLAHLQLVIGSKLRRGESFFFSWVDPQTTGGGRSSIWMEGSIPLVFRYRSSKRQEINREWLEQLTLSANQPQGLRLVEEPARQPTQLPPRP